MSYVQDPPNAVQIELSEGCPLRCSFCGLNGIRGKDNDFKFMTLETAERIGSDLARLDWNCRLEFAMHGEPTANPQAVEILRILRRHRPKNFMLMLSNGFKLVGKPNEAIPALFDAGLDTLGIDEYQQVKWAQSIREKLDPQILARHNITKYEYPSDGPAGNPHQRRKGKRLVLIAPIDLSTNGTHSSLGNHCGAGMPRDYTANGKRCAKPFREMSIRYDGNVAVCCNDWRGQYRIGNVMDIGVDGVWQHERMHAARKKLYRGQRDFGPCHGCNHLSYRVGLLPDRMGKQGLPPVDKNDRRIIAEATRPGALLALPVLREWEQEGDVQ